MENKSFQSIFSTFPRTYFDFYVDEKKFKKMEELIWKEDLNGLKEFSKNTDLDWIKLAIYVVCNASKTQLVLELKEEMDNFDIFFECACLATNIELMNYFYDCGLTKKVVEKGL
jgi:hypothetical protein